MSLLPELATVCSCRLVFFRHTSKPTNSSYRPCDWHRCPTITLNPASHNSIRDAIGGHKLPKPREFVRLLRCTCHTEHKEKKHAARRIYRCKEWNRPEYNTQVAGPYALKSYPDLTKLPNFGEHRSLGVKIVFSSTRKDCIILLTVLGVLKCHFAVCLWTAWSDNGRKVI